MQKNGILFVITLGMLAAFGPVCTDIYLPALPEITIALQTNPSSVQLSLTTAFLGLAVGQIIIGPLSDVFGRKLLLILSLILFVISSVLCAISTDITALIVFRLFQGLSGAGGIVLSRAIACDLYRGPELTKFMALLMTINSVAPVLGPVLGSFIIMHLNFRYLFYFLALWALLLLVATVFKVNETCTIVKKDHVLLAALKNMYFEFKNLKFMFLVFSMSFIMGGFFAYLSASPFVFQVIYGYSSFAYALVFAVIAILISVLAQIAGRFSKRLGDIKIVYLSQAVMVVSSLALLVMAFIVPNNSIYVLIALMCFVPMIGSSQTAGFGIVMSSVKGAAGAASGIFGVTTFIFGAITSPLVGLLGDQSMLPLAICMLICSIVSIVCFVIGTNMKQH